jgi:hypothetical protein
MSTEMVRETEALQPPILLSHDDYNLLTDLAKATLARYPADDAQLHLRSIGCDGAEKRRWTRSEWLSNCHHVAVWPPPCNYNRSGCEQWANAWSTTRSTLLAAPPRGRLQGRRGTRVSCRADRVQRSPIPDSAYWWSGFWL